MGLLTAVIWFEHILHFHRPLIPIYSSLRDEDSIVIRPPKPV